MKSCLDNSYSINEAVSCRQRILVVNLAGLGDIIISSPAIKALRNRFRKDDIYLLTFSDHLPLVEHCPYFKEVFTFDKRISVRNMQTLNYVRNLKFDIAINLYRIHSWRGSAKMRALFNFIGAPRTFGRNTHKKGFFYNCRVNESVFSLRHESESMLDAVGLLGAYGSPEDLELWLIDKSQKVDEFFKEHRLSQNKNIVCIHPGANRKIHRWPLERFARLADQLIDKYTAEIIIVGHKRERKLAQKMTQFMQHSAIIASGKFSLSDLSVLLRKCRLFITNDTGPMHIANVLGVPMVVISGATPENFLPRRKDGVVILRRDVSIKKNSIYELKNRLALNMISYGEVIKAAESLFLKTF